MREIDYETALNLMGIAGRDDIVMVIPVQMDSMPLPEIRKHANNGAMFFAPYEKDVAVPEAKIVPEKNATPPDEQPSAKRRKVDGGKIRALHEGGWSAKAIAEDVGCGLQTVYNYLKKLEEKENE